MNAVGTFLRLEVRLVGRMSSDVPASYSAVSRITGFARFFLQSYPVLIHCQTLSRNPWPKQMS